MVCHTLAITQMSELDTGGICVQKLSFSTTFLCVFLPFLSFGFTPTIFVPLLGSFTELMCSNYPIKSCCNLNAHFGSYFPKACQLNVRVEPSVSFGSPQKCFPAAIGTGAIYRREHRSVGGEHYFSVNISDGTAAYIQASE